jgi:hypothetical protein
MASEADSPKNSVAEGITTRDKQMTALKLLVSLLDESASLFKLYLGLDTGAVVLFVKVLTDVHSSTIVLTALAISTLLFGLSALMCLKLLAGILKIRTRMVTEIVNTTPNWQQQLDSDIKKWQTDMKSAGKKMEWVFGLAILFAGIFVVGILITH